MNPKESLQHIKKLAPETISQSALYNEAFATLAALVERDVEKKAIQRTFSRPVSDNAEDGDKTITFYDCPVCQRRISRGQTFCSVCGQRFDWSDNK